MLAASVDSPSVHLGRVLIALAAGRLVQAQLFEESSQLCARAFRRSRNRLRPLRWQREQRHVSPSAGRTERERNRAGMHQAIGAARHPITDDVAPVAALRQDRQGVGHTGSIVIVAGQLMQCKVALVFDRTLGPPQSNDAIGTSYVAIPAPSQSRVTVTPPTLRSQ